MTLYIIAYTCYMVLMNNTYVHIYMYMYVYSHVHIYMYIYMHVYSHVHVYSIMLLRYSTQKAPFKCTVHT